MANQHTKRAEQAKQELPSDQALIQEQAERDQRSIPKPDPVFAHHVAVGPSNEELDKMQRQLDELRAKMGYPKVEITRDRHEKQFDANEDIDFDPLGVMDPLTILKKQHERPGFALKLMSPNVTKVLGKRSYQVVKDENGDPVKCGNMILGEIPEHMARQRRQFGIQRSNEELQSINDQSRLEVEKLKFEAKGLGLQVLEQGETVRNDGDGQHYSMGISVQRGDGPTD